MGPCCCCCHSRCCCWYPAWQPIVVHPVISYPPVIVRPELPLVRKADDAIARGRAALGVR